MLKGRVPRLRGLFHFTQSASRIASSPYAPAENKFLSWSFGASDFRATLAQAEPGDLVYADPPYAGRHVDYFNSWSVADEIELADLLKQLPCGFILREKGKMEFNCP